MSVNNQIFYPNVSRIPTSKGPDESRKAKTGNSEFGKILGKEVSKPVAGPPSLEAKQPIKFSSHAMQRVQERGIDLNPEMLGKIGNAIDMADQKGVIDGLILTDDAAWIVSVKNRTVVTALDRDAMSGNVFTNIDGTIIV